MPQYLVAVDTEDDASYATDISADVLALTWRLGMAKAYDLIAAPSTAQITLTNYNRTYSPEHTPDLLEIGRRVRIQVQPEGDDTPTTHFVGFIRAVKPTTGEYGERLTVVELSGPESEYEQVRVLMPLHVNVQADEVLDRVFETPPLDRLTTDFDEGIATLSYIGDLWGDGITAARAIREVVEAERGRFAWDRNGVAIFRNRHHLLRATPAAALFADDMAGLDYGYGVHLVNSVQVRVRPRSIGADGTTLWTLENAQLIQPGADGEREIIGRLYDGSGQRIGALEIIPPVATVDYLASTERDGSGFDATADLDVSAELVSGGAIKLTLRNNAAESIYLLPGAKVRGTPVYPGDSVLVTRNNYTAQRENGIRALTLTLPALDSIEDAYQLAKYEMARRINPRGDALTVTVDERTRLADALPLTLFDRVSISETQTDHDSEYFIVGEAHQVTQGGYKHQITWTLEAVAPFNYWEVGVSEFDERRLAY